MCVVNARVIYIFVGSPKIGTFLTADIWLCPKIEFLSASKFMEEGRRRAHKRKKRGDGPTLLLQTTATTSTYNN